MTAPRWTHTGYAQRIVFGAGTIAEVARALKDLGARRALLVTTEGRLSSDAGAKLRKGLGTALASTFDGVQSHVPTSAVQAALQQARRDGVDSVVSFGGGSCADLGKAVCFFTEQ